LTRVVYLLHVKEPQAPRGPLSKITGHFPSQYTVSNSSGRWFRRSLVGGASGTIALRGYGSWLEIQRGRTIDHIEVAVHGETHPWKPYHTIMQVHWSALIDMWDAWMKSQQFINKLLKGNRHTQIMILL
jgi:hypothetical protein